MVRWGKHLLWSYGEGLASSQIYKVISHEMDSLLKLIFSNPNGICTCYSMHPNRQSIKVMNGYLHS